MAYYVYILQSTKDGRYYIGSTSDLEKRLAFHNRGLLRALPGASSSSLSRPAI